MKKNTGWYMSTKEKKMTDWSKIGKSSRAKGARFEREIVRQINDALGKFGVQVARTQRGVKQGMEGDIVLENGSADYWPYDAELKYRSGPPIALADYLIDSWWGWKLIHAQTQILIVKTARKPAIVFYRNLAGKKGCMIWDQFLERVRQECDKSYKSPCDESSVLLPRGRKG